MVTTSRLASKHCLHGAFTLVPLLPLFCLTLLAASEPGRIFGRILDPQGVPVADARLKLVNSTGAVIRETKSEQQGIFIFEGVEPGEYRLTAETDSFVAIIMNISIATGEQKEVSPQFRQIRSVLQAFTVVALVPSSLAPDPAQRIFVHDQVLDANPGRPGAPISIPGLPIETASGGIKAPQYFAPGVAGDHGEPIAQFFQVGGFLYPNNLPANAHGNGYSDPNALIPATIGAVNVDGGAFNIREGNNSVDLAVAYVPNQRVNSFVQLTGDYRDVDVMGGWGPRNPRTNAWVAGEASYGNGFLDRLEHHQQYKLNGFRQFTLGSHELTLYGIGYYGFSDIPGLIPINVSVPGDTIDSRQSDTTHTILFVATDNWRLDEQRQISFSGFFRNYALQLRSNFGDGLIQQSETRNVVGSEVTYIQNACPRMAVLAGVDLRRDAPRNLDLKQLDEATGTFQPITSNNLTVLFVEPFVSLDGTLSKYVHYDLGFRQEEVWMDNQDLENPGNSFNKLASLTLPKATVTFLPPNSPYLPKVAFSYGEAFHTEDPRIGTGSGEPSLLAPSHSYQLVFSKVIKQTQINIALRRTSNSEELAKISPDTGLQRDFGPSLNSVLAVSVQRNFSRGAIYASYAQADARESLTGQPVPEAPRLNWDVVGSENKLPFRLQAQGEFEYVRAKPLGDGYVGVPNYEFRGAVLRPFRDNRMSLGVNFLIAKGYTGQTTETLPSQPNSCPIECVVGVPLKSYVSLSWTYYFNK
jgi:hypothetical protein